MPQSVPPDLVFFVFFINLGNFNRQNPGFWRKASGPEHKLLRDPATQAVSLQAAFQSELICKQMQGLLLRPVDCSESLSLRLFGIGQVQCHYAGDPVQSVGKMVRSCPPRLLPAQNDDQIFLLAGTVICNDLRQCHEPHCFVHNSPGHEVGHVFSLEGYTPVLSAVIG